jgi:hypothetical protein
MPLVKKDSVARIATIFEINDGEVPLILNKERRATRLTK